MPTTLVFNLSKFQAAFEESGISKLGLSRLCGYANSWPIYEYLLGRKTPQAATIEKLAAALGRTPEDLCDVYRLVEDA